MTVESKKLLVPPYNYVREGPTDKTTIYLPIADKGKIFARLANKSLPLGEFMALYDIGSQDENEEHEMVYWMEDHHIPVVRQARKLYDYINGCGTPGHITGDAVTFGADPHGTVVPRGYTFVRWMTWPEFYQDEGGKWTVKMSPFSQGTDVLLPPDGYVIPVTYGSETRLFDPFSGTPLATTYSSEKAIQLHMKAGHDPKEAKRRASIFERYPNSYKGTALVIRVDVEDAGFGPCNIFVTGEPDERRDYLGALVARRQPEKENREA